MELKKVGIITYYNFYNYGSSLQAYALSEKIKSCGYDVYLIDYANLTYSWNKKLRINVLGKRALSLLIHPTLILRTLFTKKVGKYAVVSRSKELREKFDDFFAHNFKFPTEDYTQKNTKFWAFVSGSDQVWQLSAPGLHHIFFLRFCEKKKRISYAASFGTVTVPSYNRKKLEKYLNDFNYISVREDVGVEIVQNYAPKKDVQQVLDPVLLMSSEWWNEKRSQCKVEDRYILCYFLGPVKENAYKIRKIAEACNANVVWVATGYEECLQGEKILEPTPFEFLDLVANAEFVCTDSLHGTEVAITFEKQFIVFARNYLIGSEQRSRIDSLLRMLKLEDRMEESGTNDTAKWYKKIEYESVQKILEEMRVSSSNYLKNALERS